MPANAENALASRQSSLSEMSDCVKFGVHHACGLYEMYSSRLQSWTTTCDAPWPSGGFVVDSAPEIMIFDGLGLSDGAPLIIGKQAC